MPEHDELIQDQFTKQALPFSKVKWHNHDALMRLILEATAVEAEDTVLDVACGPGIVACELAKRALFVTGVDTTPAMIELAKERQEDMYLQNMRWQVADAYKLPFKDESFSVIVTRFSFHHFLRPVEAFKEMLRVAKPGARIVVVDVFMSEDAKQAERYDRMEKLRDPSHARTLPLKELMEMYREAGMKNINYAFFRLEVDLEGQLAASFPVPGGSEAIRQLFEEDLKQDVMRLKPRREAEKVYFSYPIVVLAGDK